MRVRMNRGFDGARIVSGNVDGDSSMRGFIETDADKYVIDGGTVPTAEVRMNEPDSLRLNAILYCLRELP